MQILTQCDSVAIDSDTEARCEMTQISTLPAKQSPQALDIFS